MSSKTNILVTGVTGYVGGTIVTRLLKHPDAASFDITVILRSAAKAEKLKGLGLKAVVGSHDDQQLIESLAAESDVVIAVADADSLAAANATLAGLKKRHAATGVPPIYIHTSGAAVVWDDAVGDRATDVIYSDDNVEQIWSLPDTQLHRNVELVLVNADKEGYVKTYIVAPSLVYGIPSGVLVDQSIQNTRTILTPLLIKAALDRGRSGVVGQGKNIRNHVDIDDTADLYIVLLDAIRHNPETGHGREGYYFGENGEATAYEVARAIGQGLSEVGKIHNPEPTPFTQEEVAKNFVLSVMGRNTRCRANRSRAIGWNPKKTKSDFLASFKPAIELELKGAVKA